MRLEEKTLLHDIRIAAEYIYLVPKLQLGN